MGFAFYIATSLALIFVIEGLLYALFPEGVKKMFAMALAMPAERLRGFGAVMVLAGISFLLLLKVFATS